MQSVTFPSPSCPVQLHGLNGYGETPFIRELILDVRATVSGLMFGSASLNR